MPLFGLKFQQPPASLKLTEVAFDSVRILRVKFSDSENFLPCLCLFFAKVLLSLIAECPATDLHVIK